MDDEQMIADTLSVIFRRLGYEAFTAYNGLLGLDAARDLKPDLVLSDVVMPELDGVKMAMQICRYSAGGGCTVVLRAGRHDGFTA